MSIEDTIGYQHEVESCVVCGKNVQGGGGLAKVNHGGIMVNLCCLHCAETFQQDPEPHMKRLAKVESYRALKKLQRPPESEIQ